jgi:hypothetical protein
MSQNIILLVVGNIARCVKRLSVSPACSRATQTMCRYNVLASCSRRTYPCVAAATDCSTSRYT